MGGRVLIWVGAVIAVATMAGLGVYFARVGLVEADQMASVIGLFVAVAGLAVAIAGLRLQRRGDGSLRSAESPQDTINTANGENLATPTGEGPRMVRQRAKAKGQGRVYQAGRDQTINER
jgi:hypothetical protein